MVRTLDDVAELSGVSRATVSRVINGGPVADTTRRRVLDVLEQTSFRPNAAARTLASGRSGVVGVVMHIDTHLLFLDPYFSLLLQGMSDVLSDLGGGMMMWLGNRSKEETLEQILSIGLLDGVVVTAHQLDDPLVDGLLASSLPTVLIGHRRADRTASYVDIDNVQAADMVTTHMVGTGRRKVGHITGTRRTVAGEDRLEGYRHAMVRAGLSTAGLIVEGDFNETGGARGAAVLLDAGADAMFCANDRTAVGAMETIRARGLRIPDDVAVAGFDDLDIASHLDPPLTTVRQEIKQQGAEAATALSHLIGDPEARPRRVVLPTELVVRRSTVGGVSDG
jgi:DNA-binding LacI/PurR family transcriptional regulator